MATKLAPVNKKANEVVVKAKVAVESWRFQAYVCFWGMCMFAIAGHRILVAPKMLKGPADGRPCGPYDRVSHLCLEVFKFSASRNLADLNSLF
jgi:hypothetical protein